MQFATSQDVLGLDKLAGIEAAADLGFDGVELVVPDGIHRVDAEDGMVLDLDGIEVRDDDLWTAEGRARVREAADEHGIALPSVCPSYLNCRPGLASPDPDERAATAGDLADLIEAAADLGAGTILTPFFYEAEIDGEADRERVVAEVRDLAPLAEEAGVTLALETSLPPETDRAMLRAARETLGADVDLMVDVGMAWGTDVKRAVKEAAALDEEFDLFWVEEPVYADHLDAYAAVSEACPARVVGGEREYTQYGFSSFIDRGNPDGVQPDVAVAGGITQMDKIATMAKNAGIPIYPHGYSTDVVIAANLHVIAANRNAPLLEYCVEDSPLRWDLVEESFDLVGGEVPIPDRPGLGITLDRDALAEYAVEPWTDW